MPYKDKDKAREYSKQHREKNVEEYRNSARVRKAFIREYIKEYKQNKGYSICGEMDTDCLDFHHRDPDTKVFQISRSINKKVSIERLETEIAKCDLVCCNCHRKLHYKD